MEITGTLARLREIFQDVHTRYYRAWHDNEINDELINDVIGTKISTGLTAKDNVIIAIANLLKKKIDGGTGGEITSIEDIDTKLLNTNPSQDNSLNLVSMDSAINTASKNFYEGVIIPAGSDLNDYVEVGVFRYTTNDVKSPYASDNSITNIRNAPDDLTTRFNLRVLKSASTTIVQILSTYINNDIYVRSRQNANTEWREWSKIYNSSKKIISNEIGWGQEFASTAGPIDAATIPDISTNRLSFLPSNCIGIYTNENKTNLYNFTNQETGTPNTDLIKKTFISSEYKLYGGNKNTIAPLQTSDKNKKIVIEVNAKDPNNNYKVYTHLRKVYVHINKNKCEEVTLKVTAEGTQMKNGVEENKTYDSTDNNNGETYQLLGASGGWNIIPLNMYFGNFNIRNNTEKEIHYDKITFTFNNTDVNLATSAENATSINSPEMYYIDKIRFIGEEIFLSPSKMAETGHIYTYDGNQNTTFPNDVTVTGNISANNLKWTTISSQAYNDSNKFGYGLYINPATKIAELRIMYTTASTVTDKELLTIPEEYAPKGWNIFNSTNHDTKIRVNSATTSTNPRKVILQGTATSNSTHQGSCIWHY